MTEAKSPGEVVERLETWAQERADAALHHASRGDYSLAGKCESDEDRLRAAASLIRERETLIDRYESALKWIAEHSRDVTGAPEMVKCALKALEPQ